MRKVHCLVADLHLAVKTSFLRQVTDLLNVILGDRTTVEKDVSAARYCDTVNDADERGLTGTVRAEKTENLSFRDLQRDIVQSHLLSEALADILTFNNSHMISFI